MPDSFAEKLADEVPAWVDEGLIEPEQAEAILQRYEYGGPETDSGLGSLLYAAASVLLGASIIALVLVGIDPADPEPALAVLGLALSASGATLGLVHPQRGLLADTLMAAGLAPLAAAVAQAPTSAGLETPFVVAGLAAPLGLIAWRRNRPFVAALSVLGFTVASGFAFFEIWDAESTRATAWLTVQAILLAGLVAMDRWWTRTSSATSVSLAVAATAVSLVYFLAEGVEISGDETIELALGGVMLALIVAGLALKDRGLVLGGSIVLGIDAFVFAFTVGGPWLGAGLLAATALALIWQAEALKDWLARPV